MSPVNRGCGPVVFGLPLNVVTRSRPDPYKDRMARGGMFGFVTSVMTSPA